jgi:hypothetical protein
MIRGPSGTVGFADNGRIFKEVQPDGTLLKLESGQLLWMLIPGS